MWRFPHLCDEPLRPQYASQWWALPWDPNGRGDSVPKAVAVSSVRWDRSRKTVVSNDASLRAWQFGKTGYPLVDAAMRELWVTGYMPNYTRHVVAGFLIEYLNVDWRHGQLWFHDTLVDADVAIQVQTVSLPYPNTQLPPNHHPITDQSSIPASPPHQGFMWQNGGHSGMDQWNFVMHPVFAAKSAVSLFIVSYGQLY